MSDTPLSFESAEKQLEELLDFYEIKKEHIVSEHGKDAIETIYNRLVDAIQHGRLEVQINDEGIPEVIQTLRIPLGDSSTITYGLAGAKAKLAMDGISDSKGTAKLHAFMASLAGLPPKAMQLKGPDNGHMERLALIFQLGA